MNKIIMPGDPGWNKPASFEQPAQTPKLLPDEMLEKVFSDVVKEVQEQINVSGEATPAEAVASKDTEVAGEGAVPQAPKGPTYAFHRPARQRSFTIPMPKPLHATLLEDLPRAWEEQSFVGGVEYVAVEGQSHKNRVLRPGFRAGDKITLTSMVLFDAHFYPGAGALYEFEEGKRGSFCVRPDQVSFQLPVAETESAGSPQLADSDGAAQGISEEVNDGTVAGSGTEV